MFPPLRLHSEANLLLGVDKNGLFQNSTLSELLILKVKDLILASFVGVVFDSVDFQYTGIRGLKGVHWARGRMVSSCQ